VITLILKLVLSFINLVSLLFMIYHDKTGASIVYVGTVTTLLGLSIREELPRFK
jgi:hypothetical protein